MKPILFDISDIWLDSVKSSLRTDAIESTGTISVYSPENYTTNQILLISNAGDESSEIIKTHATTTPSGNTVTLASNLVKTHPKDVNVTIIPFDQIEVSHSSTESGTKTVLSIFAINPSNLEVRYDDYVNSSGFYFTRYKNTITNVFSSYSDAIPFSGYNSNMVGYIIQNVMSELDQEFSNKLSYQTLINKINNCLRFTRGKLKRWSHCQEFDYVVSQISRGIYKYQLPTTYYDKNSPKSCLSVRVGSNQDLAYRDKREFNEILQDVILTTVSTQIEIGDTSIVLTNTSDLPDSGTINIYLLNIKYEVSYTANDKTTNTLSGIDSGTFTVQIPVLTNVWYGESEETPNYYTIYDGFLFILGLVPDTDAGKNIYMDFYTDIVEVDSDTDIIPNNRYDMIENWLKWEIRNITENNGKRNMTDGDYIMFLTILADAIRREDSGQKFKRKYKLNGIFYNQSDEQDFDRT